MVMRSDGPAFVGNFHGGSGGVAFHMQNNLEITSKAILKTIVVRCGKQIDAIECIFRTRHGDQRSGRFGGTGGADHTFRLYEGERIIRVEGRASNNVDRLQFFTNMDRKSEVYGGSGGEPFVWTSPVGPKMPLLCFHGRSGCRVDGLAPVWSTDPTENGL